ncbi:MAG: xanthine dehydrogenase accessory factor [Acidimicrobiia bacterium]|jgi:xanthine dehydrogenase accessory factor|nr:xanthine dehydrogenase accessory factor [Acidimicrobiia bacterium]
MDQTWGVRELVGLIEHWRLAGTPAALVRAVEVTGFGAGQYDNALVRTASGEQAGAILRGVADTEVNAAVERVLAEPAAAPRTLRVGINDPEAAAGGLSCGGSALLVVEPLDALPARLWELLRSGRPVVLGTLVERDGHPKTLAFDDETTVGTLGSTDLETHVVAVGRELLANPRANRTVLEVAPGRVLIEKVLPRTRLVTVGGGEVIDALVDMARALGWLVEPMADGEPTVEAIRLCGPTDAVVVTTHHPQWGPAALASALRSDAFFVGALGSRRTQQNRAERLEALGVGPGEVARIHGPVGLDLGGRTPAETALAICAQVLAVRSGRDLPSLTDRSRPINA